VQDNLIWPHKRPSYPVSTLRNSVYFSVTSCLFMDGGAFHLFYVDDFVNSSADTLFRADRRMTL
jgi:hypothetical protein